MLPFPEISSNAFSIELFGYTLALRWYALSYIFGILIGWRLMLSVVRRPKLWASDIAPMTDRHVEDFLISALFGVVIGGRLGYVLFYQPIYFLSNPLEIFMVWTGGMSFHGGLIGVIVASFLFSRKHAISPRNMADAVALSAPPGLLLGRLANFANAELWGRPTDLPWGVIFPGQAAQDCGQAIGTLCARHPSQLYEAILEGLLLGLVILFLVRTGALKKPGLIAGTFFAGYGAARFVVEFFRQPDAQFVSQENPLGLALYVAHYGLTMGQILTIPMLGIGVYLIVSARQGAHSRRS